MKLALALADWLVWMAVGLVGLLVALVLVAGVCLLIGARALAHGDDGDA